MRSPSASPPQLFAPAPIGRRVQLVTAALVVVFLAVLGVVVWAARQEAPSSAWIWICVPLGLGAFSAAWSLSRIRDYRIAEGELIVSRMLLKARFPLAGLVAVTPDAQAMQGAFKMIGNDGLGAVAGRFRSRRLGRFRAYLTDTAKAVVLRWPDRCVVVSPDKPALFVDRLRTYVAREGAG